MKSLSCFFFLLATVLLTGAGPASDQNPLKPTRAKHLTKEKSIKSGQTTLNFDEADIGGQRKTAMGTLVGAGASGDSYEFVRVRLRWHPEMVQSTYELEAN